MSMNRIFVPHVAKKDSTTEPQQHIPLRKKALYSYWIKFIKLEFQVHFTEICASVKQESFPSLFLGNISFLLRDSNTSRDYPVLFPTGIIISSEAQVTLMHRVTIRKSAAGRQQHCLSAHPPSWHAVPLHLPAGLCPASRTLVLIFTSQLGPTSEIWDCPEETGMYGHLTYAVLFFIQGYLMACCHPSPQAVSGGSHEPFTRLTFS